MKKKGLIISTIVMVVVLIASLTTATYAWFYSSGSVSVNNVTITTSAAEGLQIAVNDQAWTNAAAVDEGHLFNGTVSYDSTEGWDGNAGWGNNVTLDASNTANFSSMVHAVTRAVADTRYPFKVVTAGTVPTGATVYAVAEGGAALNASAIEALAADTTVYCTYSAGTYIVPTAYDSSINPIAYDVAVMNTNYLVLPIVLQATSGNIAQVYYTVTVTPTNTNGSTALSQNLYPYMAAATRILLNDSSSVNDLFQPFNDAAFSGSTMVVGASDTKYNAHSTTGRRTAWTYSGFVYNGDQSATGTVGTWDAATDEVMPAYTAQQFYLTVWIEGTDPQCRNLVSGSGFTIEIEFGYIKTDGTLKIAADIGVDKDLF